MAWHVFYSYSHKDTDLCERLRTYLAPLKQNSKISEWYDRRIEPGINWNTEINAQLDSANLILFLVSADFLASDYCFGVEVGKALERLKRSEVKVVPVLLKPCLWEESLFSELQFIPRDAKPVASWASVDEALKEIAAEIRMLASGSPPQKPLVSAEDPRPQRFDPSLDLVRRQIGSYARLYERTRQRMRPSSERTQRMEQIFQKMRSIATASYPLLDELADSPSPGERLAAVAILQLFAAERWIPFLVRLVGSEKPFVGYHATKALHFAVGAMEATVYPQLLKAIQDAQAALQTASVGFDSDRSTVLRAAEKELRETIAALAAPVETQD
jgi:hypothetical protein